ncbi:MAG: AarF/ABC1/UbiB kinase family protein [Bernardetiaceae bacterium]|nr:AarF/ABC1/UbiB kinase family protein [Bernardetiaceae bacterium]
MLLDKTVNNLNRIRQVLQVLIKYGFEDVITGTPALKRLVPPKQQLAWSRAEKSVFEYNRWERLRMIIEELGPTFIKLGQLLSNRPDVLPKGLIQEFEKLQSNVAPFNAETARSIIEQELGSPIEETFLYFDNVPIGSASIGQVHRARLRNGDDVVIKVRRPNIYMKVQTDLSLLREFVKLTESYFIGIGILNPLDIVDTFERSMRSELDYNNEARHMEQFRKIYRDETLFYVPRPYREYSTDRILIIEFVSGCKITDVAQLVSWGLNPEEVAENGMHIYLNQIFNYGFFHADPHPGNVLVKPSGMIVLIDFGMVGKLMQQQKYAFAGVFISLAQQDAKMMALNLRKLAIDSEIPDMQRFEQDLSELIEDFVVLDVDDMGMAELTSRLQQIIYRYRLQVPGSIFLILRALAILEGIGKTLHPKMQTLEYIKPYGVSILAEQFSWDNITNELRYSFSQLVSMLYGAPIEVKYILKKLRKGELTFNHRLLNYEPIIRSFDGMFNRLLMALIVAALIIGASITTLTPAPAHLTSELLGLPYVSILGFSLAIGLTLIIFASNILKERGRRKRRD